MDKRSPKRIQHLKGRKENSSEPGVGPPSHPRPHPPTAPSPDRVLRLVRQPRPTSQAGQPWRRRGWGGRALLATDRPSAFNLIRPWATRASPTRRPAEVCLESSVPTNPVVIAHQSDLRLRRRSRTERWVGEAARRKPRQIRKPTSASMSRQMARGIPGHQRSSSQHEVERPPDAAAAGGAQAAEAPGMAGMPEPNRTAGHGRARSPSAAPRGGRPRDVCHVSPSSYDRQQTVPAGRGTPDPCRRSERRRCGSAPRRTTLQADRPDASRRGRLRRAFGAVAARSQAALTSVFGAGPGRWRRLARGGRRYLTRRPARSARF